MLFQNSFFVILISIGVVVCLSVLSNFLTSKRASMQNVRTLINKARSLKSRGDREKNYAMKVSLYSKRCALLHSAMYISGNNAGQIEKATGYQINRLINQADTDLKRLLKNKGNRTKRTKR